MSNEPFHPDNSGHQGEHQPTSPLGENPSGPAQNQGSYHPGSPYGYQPQDTRNPYQQPSYGQQRPSQPAKEILFGLTYEKRIVPNSLTHGRPPVHRKSAVVAYLLWFFFGWFGAHQFYIGNNSRGFFMFALWGITLAVATVLHFLLVIHFLYFVYWVYDAAVLTEQTREVNAGYVRKSIL